jgi:hypothetical protein
MLKKFFAIVMVAIFAFSVPVVQAFATEPTVGQVPAQFHALSNLPDARQGELPAMTDEQLAVIEGAAFFCVVCINAARVNQTNVSAFSFGTFQSNGAIVVQSN